MNNEPIAWITEWDGEYSSGKVLDWVAHARGASAKHTPLYTAPRELSDEEIKAIANNLTCTPDKNWNVLFAKAILKKASEK